MNENDPDRGCSDELVLQQLGAATEEQPVGVTVHRRVGEEAQQQRADDPTDEVDGDHVETVVPVHPFLDPECGEASRAGDRPDDHRRCAPDESGARRDRHQAGDGTGRGAQGRRVAPLDPLDEEPTEHPRRRCQLGVDDRLRGDAVGGKCRPGIEAHPSEPENSRAEHRERKVVGWHGLGTVPASATDHEDDGEGRHAGVDVDGGPSREVEGTHLVDPPVGVEHPAGDRCVDEQ